MAVKRSRTTQSQTIRCPYCGEDYAASYKRCPFCDELPEDDDYEYEAHPSRARSSGGSGGKRLITNTRGGGYGGRPSMGRLIGTIISLVIIVAAVIIVITQILPLLRGGGENPAVSPSPSVSVQPTGTPQVSPSPEDTPPQSTTDPSTGDTPATEPSQSTEPGTVSSFTLAKSEFTISNSYPDPVKLEVTFSPAGTEGTITWSSSNPTAVQVSASGVVSAGTRMGSATITGTLENGFSRTCTVHNTTTTGDRTNLYVEPSGGGDDTTTSSTLALSREDFTLAAGESYRVRLSGTTSTPTWSIGNTSVATVSGDGTVTHVGAGSTTLTCTVDGKTLTCIVRCN